MNERLCKICGYSFPKDPNPRKGRKICPECRKKEVDVVRNYHGSREEKQTLIWLAANLQRIYDLRLPAGIRGVDVQVGRRCRVYSYLDNRMLEAGMPVQITGFSDHNVLAVDADNLEREFLKGDFVFVAA